MARNEKIPSRNASHQKDAKNPPNPDSADSGGGNTDGEGMGVGTIYTATLNERENKSLNRNAGPGRPSANNGEIPTPDKKVRKTGRI